MTSLSKLRLSSLLAGALIAGALACNSVSNNDNGRSFRALGFFEDGLGERGDVGTIVYINEPQPGLVAGQGVPLFVPVDKDLATEGLQGGFLGVQNNLVSQGVRIVRMDCDYTVSGSGVSIPSDSWNYTAFLGPADGSGGDIAPVVQYSQVIIASTRILEFLTVNENRLPPLPYNLVATCVAVGVTDAGDTVTTNPVNYTIVIAEIPDGFVRPITAGGGVPNTFGDPDAEDFSSNGGNGTVDAPADNDPGPGSSTTAGASVLSRDAEQDAASEDDIDALVDELLQEEF